MATLAWKLFVNSRTRSRQLSDLSSTPDPVSRMGFLKYEQVPFEVAIIEPDPTNPRGFRRIDITDLSLKMVINDTADDATPKAETSGGSWVKDTGQNVFIGTLNLNTAAMNDYITADKTPFFELEVTSGANRLKILSELCNVSIGVTQTTTTSPDPSRVYLDYNETFGIFVPRSMGNGESIAIPSANGLYRRILGCNDDGTRRDDIEEL